MGLSEWRTRRSMRDPVRGTFTRTGDYFTHPGRTPMRSTLTGVITAPGLAAVPAECPADRHGRWVGTEVYPVLVDRAEPTRFVVLWDEIARPDWQADARQRAQDAADRMNADGPAQPPPRISVQVQGMDPNAPVPDWARELAEQALTNLTGAANTDPAAPTLTVDGELPPMVLNVGGGHPSAAEADRLIRTGEPATATVTAITPVDLPQALLPGPDASLVDLSLRVIRRDGSSYPATTRQGFRSAARRAQLAVPGAVLPVRLDPADPARVVIDVPAFDADHPSV